MLMLNDLRLLTDVFEEMSTITAFRKPNQGSNQKFPHYNIKKLTPLNYEPSDTNTHDVETTNEGTSYELYQLELALAGYNKEDIIVTSEIKKHRNIDYQNITIGVDKKEMDWRKEAAVDNFNVSYLEKGITNKPFQFTFVVMKNDTIQDTTFEDGILRVTVKRTFDKKDNPVKRINIS